MASIASAKALIAYCSIVEIWRINQHERAVINKDKEQVFNTRGRSRIVVVVVVVVVVVGEH